MDDDCEKRRAEDRKDDVITLALVIITVLGLYLLIAFDSPLLTPY